MIEKKNRIDALRMLISSRELSTQTEVLKALKAEGFDITQGTLSRDFKQLRISRATTQSGKKVLVLPNETMYKRGVNLFLLQTCSCLRALYLFISLEIWRL